MKNRQGEGSIIAAKKIRISLAMLLICSLLLSLCACAGNNGGASPAPKTSAPDGTTPASQTVTVKHDPDPPALETADQAAALALSQYIYARMKTEA